MRVLLVSLLFEPDLSANSYAVSALASGLAERGHELTVLTAMPHYGQGGIYDGYRGRVYIRERRDGIDVRRTWLYVPGRQDWIFGKVLSWAFFNAIATPMAALAGAHDVAMTLPPPPTLGLTLAAVKAARGLPYVYNVQDVFPDAVIAQGIVRDERLIRLLRRVEDAIYRHAAVVTAISEDIRDNLHAKGVPRERLEVIPNCFDTELISPGPRTNVFAAEHGLLGRTVVMYAGNLGESVGVETLTQTMRLLAERDDIVFAIAGRGTALPRLKRQCAEIGLANVRFLPFQDRSTVSMLHASSDVQLLLQRRVLAQSQTPTKLLSILSSGRPVVASVDRTSDSAAVIRRAGAGLVVDPEDPKLLAIAIEELTLSPERRAAMGASGRDYVVRHYAREVIAERYERILERAAASRGSRNGTR